MPVTITNLQPSGPLHVPLTSGRTLRLSPGQSSEAIPDVEVENNDQVDRLVGGGLVEVATAEDTDEDDVQDSGAHVRPRRTRGRASASAKSDDDAPDQ
jgi:hypothetical protein